MVRTASSQNLLYVSSPHLGNVYVYNYSKGKLVGTLTGLFEPLGECVDKSGNVFVVTQVSTPSSGSNVYEYAHGGSSPITVLSEPGYAEGCAIDPKTGNLAVANIDDANNPYYNAGDVAIYTSAQGDPTMYYTSQFSGLSRAVMTTAVTCISERCLSVPVDALSLLGCPTVANRSAQSASTRTFIADISLCLRFSGMAAR